MIAYALYQYGKNPIKDQFLENVETVITVLFFIEITLRVYFSRSKFFTSIWNIIDFFSLVVVLLIYGYSILVSFEQLNMDYSEDLTIVLLAIRYSSQAFRIVLDLKTSSDIREAAKLTFTLDKNGEDNKEMELVHNL